MGVDELGRLLRPRTLAVVGDSRAAARVIERNRALGFEGPIWPVHPTAVAVAGAVAFRSVAELPGPPDAAFVAVPAPSCAPVVEALSAAGCGGAVVYSSGFAETGPAGAARQRALLAAAGAMPLLGPNCYGLINYADPFLIWPDQHGGAPLRAGERGVAVVSQSSSIAISATMADIGLPLGQVITIGNGAQIGAARAAAALLDDDRVSAIGLVLESLADVRGLEALAARARARGIGVVALLLGRTEQARQAVLSHTGSLSSDAAIGSDFLRRNGIGEVTSVDGLLGALSLLHCGGPLAGTRLSSLSCSGGEAALMADAAHGRRARFDELTGQQRAELGSVLGERVTLANPLDYHTYIWGDGERMAAAFEAMVRGPADVNLLFADLPRTDRCTDDDWTLSITAFARACAAAGARGALVAAMAANLAGVRAAEWVRRGLPVLAPPGVALEAVEAAASIGAAWAGAPAVPVARPGRVVERDVRVLDEAAAKDLLRRHGVPVPDGFVCRSVDAALAAADLADGPVAVKALGCAHKTDQQAVHIGLKSADGVRAAATDLLARFPAVLVERMITGGVVELLVGVEADPVFGPVLTLGAGGTLTELLHDATQLVLPVGPAEIRQALLSLRCAPLLTGFRGRPAVDLEALVTTVSVVLEIALGATEQVTVEINPLIVTPDSVWACDALVTVAAEGDR